MAFSITLIAYCGKERVITDGTRRIEVSGVLRIACEGQVLKQTDVGIRGPKDTFCAGNLTPGSLKTSGEVYRTSYMSSLRDLSIAGSEEILSH